MVRQFEVEAERSEPAVQVAVATNPQGLELTAQAVVTCTREQKKVVKRWRETERTTSTGLHAVVYALGAIGGLGGGALIYEAETAATPEDRKIPVGDQLETGKTVGISAAAAGGLLLVVGVASSIAARDDRKLLGDIEEAVPGSRTTAECDRKPAAGADIALVMPARGGQPAPVVPLGKTDAQGRLVVAWKDIKTPGGIRVEGDVVVGAVDALRGDVAIGNQPKGHGKVAGPEADPEAEWTAAVAANTPEAYEAYRAKFPSSPHAAEALDRARAGKARVALVQFDEALATNKLDVAAQALVTLRANADAATIESAQARYDLANRTTRLAAARQQLPALIAAVDTASDPSKPVADAKNAIEAIREADVEEAARAQVQLDAMRKRAVARLTREGADAYKRRDYAAGTQKFDIATTIALDVTAVARARTRAFADGSRAALAQGRSLVRERQFDAALAIADTLLQHAPNDNTVTAERARWVAARDRYAKVAADKEAREAARLEAAARAQAEKEARVEAARQQAEERKQREEAARAAKLAEREQRKQREEAARAAKLAEREARKQAAAEKRRAAEAERAQRLAAAAAKKEAAAQERLAAAAERARVRAEAEARRAEEARQRAEEARRRAEQARTGIPMPTGPRVPPAVPASTPPMPAVPPVRPAGEDLAEARRHFEQGIALYNTGDYNAALVEFEASHRLNPQPFVLKNIGLTQKALFRYAEAIASLEKFLSSSHKFQAPDPQETQKLVVDMKALLADVSVMVMPDGAQITIDGRVVGVSPLPRVVQLASGAHTIEATAEGHHPAKRDVMVTAGVPLSVEMTLEEIATKGKVRITSTVPRATVKIDGKPVGYTPLEIELESGGHRVELSAPKHKPSSTELVVTAGQTREVSVPLERDIPPKKKWYMNKYVWAGAGAAVLGVVVLGVTMSGTEAPLDGTLGTGSAGAP